MLSNSVILQDVTTVDKKPCCNAACMVTSLTQTMQKVQDLQVLVWGRSPPEKYKFFLKVQSVFQPTDLTCKRKHVKPQMNKTFS